MPKSKLNINRKRSGTSCLTYWMLILVITIFSMPYCIGQNTKAFSQPQHHREYPDYLPEVILKLNSYKRSEYIQATVVSGNRVSDKNASQYSARLDSVYEYMNYGYYFDTFRWYYKYDGQQQPDTIRRCYYSGTGEYEDITEISAYNAAGQLQRFVRSQPDFWHWSVNNDSTIKEAYIEEYKYQEGNMIQKTTIEFQSSIIGPIFYPGWITNDYYAYDQENKLIHYSTIGYEDDYYYTPDGDLEYVLDKNTYYTGRDTVSQYYVDKYVYEITDSTRTITWKSSINSFNERPLLDTITQWYLDGKYYEKYDKEGRRTYMAHYNSYLEELDYKAEYTWTESNKLLHASYFDWQGTANTGVWKESLRTDNTYDAAGNLLKFEKTFYNDGRSLWETDQSKTYYYTSVPVGLPANITNSATLCIFPNPAKNEITIRNLDGGTSNYTIYNLYGQPLISGRLGNQAIAVSQLKPGLYIIELRNGHSIYSGKFVKY